MKILVTGGAGFIASNIVDKLVELDYSVVVVDNLSSGKRENVNSRAKFYEMDINSPELKKIFSNEDITHVLHHAAQIDVQFSIRNPLLDINNNITGTVNLLECCREYNIDKVIYASSAAVYGKPDYLPVDEKHPVKALSPYGVSKHTPEHYLKIYKELYDLDYTVLRYANVYGPRQDPTGEGGVVSIFVDKMLAGKRPVIFGDGEQTRDFIYVEDIASANVKALSAGDNRIINISCKSQDSVNDLQKSINQILNINLKAIYKEEREGDIKHSYLDNSKAEKFLDWKPAYNLLEGLKKTVEYYMR